MQKIALLLASVLTAVVLIVALFWYGNIEPVELWRALVAVPPAIFGLILLLSAAQILISTWKWRLVAARLAPSAPLVASASLPYFYTGLGALLSQLVPVHISTIAARTIGMRLHGNKDLIRGAMSSLIEQSYDLLVPLIIAVTSIIFLVWSVDSWIIFAISAVISLLIGGIAVTMLAGGAIRLFLRFIRPIAPRLTLVQSLSAAIQRYLEAGIFEPRLVFKLYVLSMARYGIVLSRACLVVVAAGLSIELMDVVTVLPLVQLSLVFAVTPGSLGIVEWTWTGLLAVAGADPSTAGQFALLLRIFILVSLSAIVAPSLLYLVAKGARPRILRNRPPD